MADVNIDINVVAKQALASLKAIEGQANKSTSSFGALSKSVVVFNQGFQLVKGLANAAKGAIGAFVGKAIEMEKVETQFQVFTKSAAKSKALLSDLQQFAATTPFQLPSLAAASKTLLSFGSTAEEIVPRLKFLGDAAAATGKDIGELTLIFGQVQAAGKLTGERLLQLQERGINVLPVLSKELGVTQSAVKQMVSAGKIDFDTFEKAFKSMSGEGGLFFEGMVKQSTTLGGVISTLGDNFDLIATDIGNGFLPSLKQAGLSVIQFLQANREFIKSKALEFIDMGLSAISSTLQFFIKLKGFAVAAIEGLKNAFISSFQAIDTVTIGYIKAKIALKSLVGANVEAEQRELALLEARKKGGEEIKKQNENEAIIAFEKSDRQSLFIAEEFEKIQAANAAKEEENKRHNDTITTQDNNAKKGKEKNNKSFFDSFKSELTSSQKYEELTDKQRVENFKATANTISSLSSSNNKVLGAIGKAGAISTATIDGYVAVQKALASAPPPYNFALASLVGVASAANIAKISGVKGFQEGGLVGGTSFTGDRVPALVNSGELILNKSQQDTIAPQLQGGNITINIESGVVENNDSLIDKIVEGINRGTEFRNLRLQGAA